MVFGVDRFLQQRATGLSTGLSTLLLPPVRDLGTNYHRSW